MEKRKKLFIEIITIFPKLFENFLKEALIARAQKKGLVAINTHNLRKWTTDNHQTVDGRPYGGGAGMVLMVEPIMKAVNALEKRSRAHVVLFSAKGKKFNQATARKWAKKKRIILICGRYEGIDERVNKYIADEEVSIGDYVLFGGEVPAMVVTEAVVRLLPGAVGKQKSIEDESFKEVGGIENKMMTEFIEYPHFTRPEKIKIAGKVRAVPKVLLSGNHKQIEAWREVESKKMTKNRSLEFLE
jgi:tRNA (guanine37-N1)-methyltransferase